MSDEDATTCCGCMAYLYDALFVIFFAVLAIKIAVAWWAS